MLKISLILICGLCVLQMKFMHVSLNLVIKITELKITIWAWVQKNNMFLNKSITFGTGLKKIIDVPNKKLHRLILNLDNMWTSQTVLLVL